MTVGRDARSATARFNSVDPLQQKYPAWSPYVYALSNPVRNLDANGAEVFSVTVDVYIPYKSVLGFRGDNRGPSSDPNRTSRIQQTVQVETDPALSTNPITGSTATTGVTVWDVPRVGFGVGHASTHGVTATGTRTSENGGNNAVVSLGGSVSNPLVPKVLRSSIDYHFQLSLQPGQPPSVSGSHDGFPAYTVTVQDQNGNRVSGYQYTPSNKWKLIELRPPEDVTVGKAKDNGAAPDRDQPHPRRIEDWMIDPRQGNTPQY